MRERPILGWKAAGRTMQTKLENALRMTLAVTVYPVTTFEPRGVQSQRDQAQHN